MDCNYYVNCNLQFTIALTKGWLHHLSLGKLSDLPHSDMTILGPPSRHSYTLWRMMMWNPCFLVDTQWNILYEAKMLWNPKYEVIVNPTNGVAVCFECNIVPPNGNSSQTSIFPIKSHFIWVGLNQYGSFPLFKLSIYGRNIRIFSKLQIGSYAQSSWILFFCILVVATREKLQFNKCMFTNSMLELFSPLSLTFKCKNKFKMLSRILHLTSVSSVVSYDGFFL